MLNVAESGTTCRFVKIGTIGLKCYNCRDHRNRQFDGQSSLADCMLAPGCWDCIDIVMPDGSVKYAFWTDIAECAVERYGMDYSNPAWRDDRDDLKGRLGCAGYNWNDDDLGNWGYYNGCAVLIDCPGY